MPTVMFLPSPRCATSRQDRPPGTLNEYTLNTLVHSGERCSVTGSSGGRIACQAVGGPAAAGDS
jgi:hypothetical protein